MPDASLLHNAGGRGHGTAAGLHSPHSPLPPVPEHAASLSPADQRVSLSGAGQTAARRTGRALATLFASPTRGVQAVATAWAMPSCGRGPLGSLLPGPCSSPCASGAAGLAAAAAPEAARGPPLPQVLLEQQAAASPAQEQSPPSLTVSLETAPAPEPMSGSPAATAPVHAPVPPSFALPQMEGLLPRPHASCGPGARWPGSAADAAPPPPAAAAPPTAAAAAANRAGALGDQVVPLAAPPPAVRQETSDEQVTAASMREAEAVHMGAPSPAPQCRSAERSKRAVLSQHSPPPCAMQIGAVPTAAAPPARSDPSGLPEQQTQPGKRSAACRKQLAAAAHPEPASSPGPRNSARLAAKRSPMTAIATPAALGSAPKAAAAATGETCTEQMPRLPERSAARLSSLPSNDAAPCRAAAKATAEPGKARPPQTACSPAAVGRSPKVVPDSCRPAPLSTASPPLGCHRPRCGLNGPGCLDGVKRHAAALVRSLRPDISRGVSARWPIWQVYFVGRVHSIRSSRNCTVYSAQQCAD